MSENTVGYTETPDYRCLENLQQTEVLGVTSPLNLRYCGQENCVPGWSFGPAIRDNYLIHVVTAGRGVLKVKDKTIPITSGQAFLIYPEEETFYQADREDPWSYMWVGFRGFAAANTVKQIGFTKTSRVITVDHPERLEEILKRMFESRGLTLSNEFRRLGAFYDFLAVLTEHNNEAWQPRRKNSDIVYVKMAVDIITSSYQSKLRITDIADRVGINRSYLTDIFKREMKMSPQEFLIKVRLERAASMIRETDLPIGHIAFTVGYPDALSFSKAFKRKYGMPPSKYKESAPELSEIDTRGGYKDSKL